jgi:predicted CoA-binding protein
MQQHGYRILPVNPRYVGQRLLGMPVVASLTELSEAVDLVDVFRRTEEVLPVAEQAIAIGARALWQQIGVVNEAAHALARASGLVSVLDRCIKVEHARWLGTGAQAAPPRAGGDVPR